MEDHKIEVTLQDNRPDDAKGDGQPYCAVVMAFKNTGAKGWYNTGIVAWGRDPVVACRCAYEEFKKRNGIPEEPYFHFSNPIKPEELEAAYAQGLIPKKNLIDGTIYRGYCRNQTEATWHADKGCFTYLRTKFGHTFPEDINHPEDDDGFDVFCPYTEVR